MDERRTFGRFGRFGSFGPIIYVYFIESYKQRVTSSKNFGNFHNRIFENANTLTACTMYLAMCLRLFALLRIFFEFFLGMVSMTIT